MGLRVSRSSKLTQDPPSDSLAVFPLIAFNGRWFDGLRCAVAGEFGRIPNRLAQVLPFLQRYRCGEHMLIRCLKGVDGLTDWPACNPAVVPVAALLWRC